MQSGKGLLIIDAGGGTIDISGHTEFCVPPAVTCEQASRR